MTPNEDLADDPRVLQAARDYLADLEAGRVPDRQTYLARYPELAEAMSECFEGIELAHAAGQAMRGEAPPLRAEHPIEPLGDFKIIREIGRGGMGIIYEAIQLSLGRRVALKVLPFASALDAKHLQRFKTEAHAAAQLHHSNIVPVYAVGCERGMHFYAMQLIEGRSLDKVIREWRGDGPAAQPSASTVDLQARDTKPDSPKTVSQLAGRGWANFRTSAQVIAQVADALEYAHEAGVVHRDIKPGNLLLDGKGNVWVTDFGLAQVSAEAGLTQTGDVFGTLRYMSPEQASGRRMSIDHRTDIYSLGATLYEMLTLQPIFPGSDRQALLHQILDQDPRPPRQIDRAVPVELETIVLKAVAKDPIDRYATAGEMAEDLRRFLDGLPILARRPTLIERIHKWVRRHPSAAAATVLALAISVIALAVSNGLIAGEKGKTDDALVKLEASTKKLQASTKAKDEALAREQQRTEEAEQRFQLARRAADALIYMAEQELIDQPQMQGLRKRLLEVALEYYQELIALRGNDAEARAELVSTRDNLRKNIDDLTVMQGMGQVFLLAESSVLDDLQTSAGQREKLAELLRRQVERRDKDFGAFHRLSDEERRQRFLAQARSNDAALAGILSADQIKRLGQISLQSQGLWAFRDLSVISALRLTPEQRERIRAIEGEMFFGRQEGPKFGPMDRPSPKAPFSPKEMDARRVAALEKVEAVLSADQLSKWKEMAGEPFKGELHSRPFGGFGGFGGFGPQPKGPDGPPDRKGPPNEGKRPGPGEPFKKD
jgi:serine/threonine protein kinase